MDILDSIRKAEAWMDEYSSVQGVSQSVRDDKDVIVIHITDRRLLSSFPAELDGYPVVVELDDGFVAY